MAQMGSNTGNFIYVDTAVDKAVVQTKVNEALNECLGLAIQNALEASKTDCFVITSEARNLNQHLKFKKNIEYTDEAEEYEPGME